MLRVDSGSGRARGTPSPPAAVRALTSAGAIMVADYGGGVAGLPAIRQALLPEMGSRPVCVGSPSSWSGSGTRLHAGHSKRS